MTLAFAVILVVGRDFSAIRENQRVYFSITVADVGYTRKPCCGRKTARCKIRYVSKFIAASRGSSFDRRLLC